jgi:ABC-2 type transport system ATP-binding protein/sodium transport system ATP-binding protein
VNINAPINLLWTDTRDDDFKRSNVICGKWFHWLPSGFRNSLCEPVRSSELETFAVYSADRCTYCTKPRNDHHQAGHLMIRVLDLRRTFQTGSSEFVAVDKLTFEVKGGEVYGLLGPNGAGKTTTLRMILGLLQPTSGDTEVDGCTVSAQPDEIKRRVGLVSTSAGLYQWLTPRETLKFFGDLYGVPRSITNERSERLCELLDLSRFFDQRCATLSTGQKQRVNLARALMHDPPVMLMDEPTRGLDVVGGKVIFDYIDHLRNEGKAVIVCTHRLDEAERLCDRFGLLFRGRIRYEGTIDEVFTEAGEDSLTKIFLKLLSEAEDGDTVPAATTEGATA